MLDQQLQTIIVPQQSGFYLCVCVWGGGLLPLLPSLLPPLEIFPRSIMYAGQLPLHLPHYDFIPSLNDFLNEMLLGAFEPPSTTNNHSQECVEMYSCSIAGTGSS